MYFLKKNINNIVVDLFLFFCFFPYLKIIPLPIDSQPTALLFAFLILIFKIKRKVPYQFLILFITSVFALFCLSIDFSLNGVRSLGNYLSIAVIPYVTYSILRSSNGLSYKLYKVVVIVWGIVALIQQLLYPSFLSFLLPRGDALKLLSSGRGVLSLAPEPTFYGIVCLLFVIIGMLNFTSEKNIKSYILLLFFQLIFLSRASLAIFVLILSLILLTIYLFIASSAKTKIKSLITLIIVACAVVFSIEELNVLYPNVRIIKLIKMVLDQPELFIIVDQSINERFIHAFFPIYGSFKSCFYPHGFNGFNDYLSDLYYNSDFQMYLTSFREDTYTRIMSGIGSGLFELGLLFIPFLFVLYSALIRLCKDSVVNVFLSILLILILHNAVPLSNALVCFVIGNIIYKSQQNENTSN